MQAQRVQRVRLDAELVRRGLARSREAAAGLIAAGRVTVAGGAAAKAATRVRKDDPITVAGPADEPGYVSRGGRKLAGALAAFSALTVAGRRCLDAGASTGGFTDVLLRAGAAHVVAADVGYGQLAWPLRTDPRVTVLDRVNVRTLRPEQVAGPAGQGTGTVASSGMNVPSGAEAAPGAEPAGVLPGLVVADLSFISLTLVLPALVACARADADFVLLVKPQFEVGRGRVGPGGVVRDAGARAGAVASVCEAAAGLGLGVRGVTASPLPGPAGNVEYFVWLRRGAPPLDHRDLRQAIMAGPQ
jgi:23S rRNA (cytidine1920-2'-O)/16S rRNA (cytidine1409-2'-O)-methyltransferase